MTDTNEYKFFGQYLRSMRIARQIELPEIARTTNISLGNLLLLESEDTKKLPAKVHVKGFIREYCRVIGADVDEVLQRYDKELCRREVAEKKATDQNSRFSLLKRLFFTSFLFMVLIMIAVYIHKLIYSGENIASANTLAAISEIKKYSNAAAAQRTQNISASVEIINTNTRTLKVLAVESTWFKAIIDGGVPLEYDLNPRDLLELKASSSFNLLFGNGAAVKLTLNDKSVFFPYKKGKMKTIQLP